MSAEPLTVTLPTAAELLGIGERTAYDLVARDEFPVPVLRIGRSLRVSRRAIEQFVDGDLAATVDVGPPLEWRGSAAS